MPGLGHLAAGRIARAALFGLPTILFTGLLAGAAVSAGPVRLGSLVLDDTVLLGLIGFQALILAWRVAAMGSAKATTPSDSQGEPSLPVSPTMAMRWPLLSTMV